MSERNVLSGGSCGRATRLVLGGLVLAALAAPADAYVVVTSDNRVFDIATKPEVHGDLVLFTLDGKPVSLRIYDVNITKTNELNHLLDSGGGAASLSAQLRQLRPAVPQDDRVIVSSRLERILEAEYGEQAQVARREMPAEFPSFDRDRPGSRRSDSSARDVPGRSFEREAREAIDEAESRVRSSRAAQQTSGEQAEPASRSGRSGGRPSRASARDAGRVADLDGEIKAEQEYLRKLTAGELTVSDLDGEIDRSMDKIKRLQKRRDAAASEASEMASEPAPAGSYPSGSREDKWERELQDAQSELARLKAQQTGAGDSKREREGVDERIGELQWKIDRLQRKLGR